MSDAPIEPRDYVYGVKVVDIGDMRVSRGMTRRPKSTCAHGRLVYDQDERRVWCQDCEQEVEPFDAFVGLVSHFDGATKKLRDRQAAIEELEHQKIVSRAAKLIDEHWRKNTTAPCCPHCKQAILPEDVVRGLSLVSKSLEIARRKRDTD